MISLAISGCNFFFSGQTGQCRVCGHWAKLLEINHKLPADVLLFFRDPKDLLEQYVKNVTAVLNFQSGHRNRLHNARQEQVCFISATILEDWRVGKFQ